MDIEIFHHPTVHRALETADRIIEDWLQHGTCKGDEEKARQVVDGWARAALRESIAGEIMDAIGFDWESLHEAVQDREPGEALSDVLARFPDVNPVDR